MMSGTECGDERRGGRRLLATMTTGDVVTSTVAYDYDDDGERDDGSDGAT